MLPKRSNVTDLSTDELLLLDAIAFDDAYLRQLSSSSYPVHNNTVYSHQLSDGELEICVNSLAHRGFVSVDGHGPEAAVSLARLGGEQWEAERTPIWSSYLLDEASPGDEEGAWDLSIYTLSHETFLAFISACKMSGLWGEISDDSMSPVLCPLPQIRWKILPLFRRYDLVLRDIDREAIWTESERNRTWWRGVAELQRLL